MHTDRYSQQEYLEQFKEIDDELKKYQSLEKLPMTQKSRQKRSIKLTEGFLRDFKQFWNLEKLEDKDRQAWIRMTIKKIWVKNHKVIGIEPREEFKPLFVSVKEVIGRAPSTTPSVHIPLWGSF